MSNVKVKTLVSNMLTKMTFIEAVHEIEALSDDVRETVISEIWRQYHEMCARVRKCLR